MSELIRRDDVQREIQTSFDEGAFRWQDGQDLLDRINALPTASPWHRVVEELPEKEGRYFIAVFYKGKWLYNVAWFVKDIGDILGVPGSDGKGGFVSNSTEVYPDCWMMPAEPPKEE